MYCATHVLPYIRLSALKPPCSESRRSFWHHLSFSHSRLSLFSFFFLFSSSPHSLSHLLSPLSLSSFLFSLFSLSSIVLHVSLPATFSALIHHLLTCSAMGFGGSRNPSACHSACNSHNFIVIA
ncbi:uncharacterized protein EURHEDRAFT_32336 [Aspergillus ruber CBS 135680]|uniref:Uncharacterized protein n=1 Tax=Aspergillus ruber (strain CBS 135680) TaxID=1388766 RepID=A0A017SU83_ASPRC|nr:uncharacterized protein EURHEDRAFT_32336 [Aspergillus ruber CBS 135680]EYE99865.1 hypothetical protein EURHEDRAFT_32336 [Aspergillus ruber CBS 135680]